MESWLQKSVALRVLIFSSCCPYVITTCNSINLDISLFVLCNLKKKCNITHFIQNKLVYFL